MKEEVIKVNEDLKQRVIDVLTNNGGTIEKVFYNAIAFKYDICFTDGTDRLFVDFKKDLGTVCKTMLEIISKTASKFFIESMPIFGINLGEFENKNKQTKE